MSLIKLTELAKGISPEEYRKLGDFVKSPFFNKSKRIIKVYSYLKQFQKKGSAALSKKNLWEYVFPEERFNDQKFRSLCSDMNKIIERFLLHSCKYNEKAYEDSILLDELRLRGAFKSFEMLYSLLKKQRNGKYYYNNNYIHFWKIEASYGMYLSNKMRVNLRTQFSNVLLEVDHAFILSKLHTNNLIVIGESPLKENFEIEDFLFKEIILYVEKNLSIIKREHKAIYLEYLIHKLITEFTNTGYFDKTMLFLEEIYTSMDILQQTHVYYSFNSQFISVSNYSIDKKYIINMFECNKYFVKKGFFDDYKLIPGTIFHNIVDTTLKADKVKFADDFYIKYSQKIDSEISGDILLLSKAKILIHKKDYPNAAANLGKISMINYQVYLNAKSFLARIYYEQKDIDAVYYVIDAAKHYLERNKKNIGMRYIGFSNYFNYVKKLLKTENEGIDITEIIRKLNTTDNVYGKSWLLEKLNEKLTTKSIKYYRAG